MKANELMIGDWVMVAECVADAHFIEYPDKVESIRDGLVGLESDGLETIIERIAPIPLTEEILEKNGFVQNGCKFTCGEISIIFTIKGFSFWTKHMINIAVDNGSRINNLPKYVHELQHALRLCGIEKEIEL